MENNIAFGNFILSFVSYEQFSSFKSFFIGAAALLVIIVVAWSQFARVKIAQEISADFEADGNYRKFQNRIFRLFTIFPFRK